MGWLSPDGNDNVTQEVQEELETLLASCGLLDFSDLEACLEQRRATVTDRDLITSLFLSMLMGLTCFTIFILLRICNDVYKTRLELTWISVKPPVMKMEGCRWIWSWLTPIIYVTDTQLLTTAGLDSLILLRANLFAMQLLVPMVLLACGILLPLHWLLGNEIRREMAERGWPVSVMMLLSSFNLGKASVYYWVHFTLVIIFVVYACWLLWVHFQSVVRMRQHYFVIGSGSYNPWISEFLEISEDTGGGVASFAVQLSNIITPSHMDRFKSRSSSSTNAKEPGIATPAIRPSMRDLGLRPVNPYEPIQENEEAVFDTTTARHLSTVSAPPVESMRRNLGKASMTLNEKLNEEAAAAGSSDGATSGLQPWWSEKESSKAFLSGKPAVPYRKLINAVTDDGSSLGVNAQQYAALVRDLPAVSSPFHHHNVMKTLKRGFTHKRTSREEDKTEFDQLSDAEEYDVEKGGDDSERLLTRSKSSFARLAQKSKKATKSFYGNITARFMPWISNNGSTYDTDDESEAGEVEDKRQKKLRHHKHQIAVIKEHFQRLFPGSFKQVVPVWQHKQIEYRLYIWDEMWRLLDGAQDRFNRTGKRPTAYPNPLARYGQGTCLSWLGPGMSLCVVCDLVCPCCCGRAVDAIDYYTQRKDQLEAEVAQLRQAVLTGPGTGSFFVIFDNQKDAAIAAQAQLFAEGAKIFTVEPAPGPDEINWSSLWTRGWLRSQCREVLLWPFIILFVLFPIGFFTASMGELDLALCSANSPVYSEWYCFHAKAFRNIVTGIVPSVLLVTYENLVLPLALYYLVLAQRSHSSFTHVDMKILDIYYCWNVFNVFLGGLLGGTVFAQVSVFAHNPGNIYNVLGTALAKQAPFFINYICFRAFGAAPLRLVYPHFNVVTEFLYNIKLLKARTPRQQATKIIPFNVRYGREYGVMFLVLLLTISFSVITPIIIPFGLSFFILNFMVFKYQILYVYEQSYESGGMHWTSIFRYTVMTLTIFVIMSACMLIACQAYIQGSLLLLLVLPCLYKYYRYCSLRFGVRMAHIPLDIAEAMPRAHVSKEMYMPPALRQGAVGWFPEIGKVWEWWWTPLYTL